MILERINLLLSRDRVTNRSYRLYRCRDLLSEISFTTNIDLDPVKAADCQSQQKMYRIVHRSPLTEYFGIWLG